ncbi:MAG: DUF6599 family protein [Candidatus Zixiibacteriota bacterium]
MKYSIRFLCLCLLIALTACDSMPQYPEGTGTEAFLLESIPSVSARRSGEVLYFPSDSLVNYLNNVGIFFQRLGCEELSTSEYMIDSILVEADLYRFSSSTNAFGAYIAMRAGSYTDSTIVQLGYEGFTDPTGLVFVKGCYMANFLCFSDSKAHTDAMYRLAEYFSKVFPGQTAAPAGFAAMPQAYAVPGIQMYYPTGFMGFEFAPPVYYAQYAKDVDTLDAFLIIDSAGPTLLKMSKAVEEANAMAPLPEGIPFDDGKGFIFNHPQYGPLLCGMKGDKVVLFFGYAENKNAFIAEWLELLK